jgi:PTS system mannose-specific IIC component
VTVEPLLLAGLLVWGTLAGVDLVTFPQAMLGRPLVAATVAGLLSGSVETGLRIGVLLECFALDVLPVGASRYPDYGPAAVAAVFAALSLPGEDLTGAALLLGLVLALVGGRAMELQRRFNGRMVARAAAQVDAGDAGALARLQRLGFAGDAVRSLLITGLGLLFAAALTPRVAPLGVEPGLTLVVVAGALFAALSGLFRRAGTDVPRLLIGAGLAVGGVLAWLI